MQLKSKEELRGSIESLNQRIKDVFGHELDLEDVKEFVDSMLRKRKLELIQSQFNAMTTDSYVQLANLVKELKGNKNGKHRRPVSDS